MTQKSANCKKSSSKSASPAGAAVQVLKEKAFKDIKVKSLQPAPDGQGMAVGEW